jgi:Cof subfamily protein (haloacid dehalogenase superfamily)
MIKLIATDVDNTLLPYATSSLPDTIVSMISELRRRGILFAVATGRQYRGLLKTFERVKDEIIFIAENGAHIQSPGGEPFLEFMNYEYVKELVTEYRKIKPEGEFLVATEKFEYMENPSEHFIDVVKNGMNCEIRIVEDVLQEKLDVLKVSLYMKDSVREFANEIMIPKWKDRVNIMLGSDNWLPSVSLSADKGLAIKKLQRQHNIELEETMVFGDGGNDIGMFRSAGESFAVENADEELKAIAKRCCPPCESMGVYHTIMEKVLGLK